MGQSYDSLSVSETAVYGLGKSQQILQNARVYILGNTVVDLYRVLVKSHEGDK